MASVELGAPWFSAKCDGVGRGATVRGRPGEVRYPGWCALRLAQPAGAILLRSLRSRLEPCCGFPRRGAGTAVRPELPRTWEETQLKAVQGNVRKLAKFTVWYAAWVKPFGCISCVAYRRCVAPRLKPPWDSEMTSFAAVFIAPVVSGARFAFASDWLGSPSFTRDRRASLPRCRSSFSWIVSFLPLLQLPLCRGAIWEFP